MDQERPRRRSADTEIDLLRGDVHDLKMDLRQKASHDDIKRLEAQNAAIAAELKLAIEKRVTLDRFRPTELVAFSAVATFFGAIVAWIVSHFSRGGGAP